MHQKFYCIYVINLLNSFHVKVELKKNDTNILSQKNVYDFTQIDNLASEIRIKIERKSR
jgi:hypothetical protein